MKKNNDSQKGSPLSVAVRRSARISSTIYKSAPALREPRTSTSRRRWSKKKKPKFNVCIGNYGLNVNWTEAQKAQYFFHNLSKSLSRKTLSFYCGPEDDERTCILPSGDTVSWTNLSCRITWIALRGITAYVVVAMDPYTEYEFRMIEYYPGMHGPANFVVLTVLNQLGDLSSILNKEIPHNAQENPFAVVSAAPATFEDPQECKLASSRAIDFLKAKLNDCSDFTFIKILKIAVCALKQMLGPNFKTNKIVQASYEGWVGGTDVLSTTEVDKCLNELNAKAMRTEVKKPTDLGLKPVLAVGKPTGPRSLLQAKPLLSFPIKGGLQFDPSIKFQFPVSKTAITSLKLRDRTIIAADARSTNPVTGKIISDSEVKIACLMNSGVYFAGAGRGDFVHAVYDFVVGKWEDPDIVVSIKVIAEAIEKGINRGQITVVEEVPNNNVLVPVVEEVPNNVLVPVNNIEILLAGRGKKGNPKMILIQKANSSPCIVNKKQILCKFGSAEVHLRSFRDLPPKIKQLTRGSGTITIDEEERAMECLMRSVARASMYDWAVGGYIVCICIRADGEVNRHVYRMENPASCASGYSISFTKTIGCPFDSDCDGLPPSIEEFDLEEFDLEEFDLEEFD